MNLRTRWIVRLYPAAWRERYGEEFTALLDECTPSLPHLFDAVWGAVDAHLHVEQLTGRFMEMVTRLRRAEVVVFCAWIAFVVAGIGFQKMTEYDDFMEAGKAYPLIGFAFTTVVVGSAVALLAVLAGGVPLALATARKAVVERRFGVLALFGVPVLSFVVLAAYLAIALHVPDGATSAAQHPTPTDKVLAVGLAGVLVLGAAASAWAISAAISRGDADERWFRFARIPTIITTVAMAVMCVAVIVWGLALWSDVPHLFAGTGGIVATSTALSWLGHVLVMSVATIVAIAAVARGLPPRAAESSASPLAAQA